MRSDEKSLKTVWYKLYHTISLATTRISTHFRVPAAHSLFNFLAIKIFFSCSNMHESNYKMCHPFDARGIRISFFLLAFLNLDEKYEMIFCKIFFAICWIIFVIVCLPFSLSLSLFLPMPPSESVYVVYAIFRTLAHKHPLEIVHTHDTRSYPLSFCTYSFVHSHGNIAKPIHWHCHLVDGSGQQSKLLPSHAFHSFSFVFGGKLFHLSLLLARSFVRPLLAHFASHKIQWQTRLLNTSMGSSNDDSAFRKYSSQCHTYTEWKIASNIWQRKVP